MTIALCVIATGKYTCFVPTLWRSALEYFHSGQAKTLFLFTDDAAAAPAEARVVSTIHRPWPGPTLYRYHTMLAAEQQLLEFTYVFYVDADMRFVAPVREESLGKLVATIHPGFSGQPRNSFTYETRRRSRAYIPAHQGVRYFAGGFQGGEAACYLQAMRAMRDAIDADLANGIVAVWHDESHWNRYLIDHPPNVELSPLYCSPESWNAEGRKLVALDKNHAAMRSP